MLPRIGAGGPPALLAKALPTRSYSFPSAYQRWNNFFRRWYMLETPWQSLNYAAETQAKSNSQFTETARFGADF